MRTILLRLCLFVFILLLGVGIFGFPPVTERILAQDEPTDVPFPTSVATSTMIAITEATLESTAESTAALTIDDALATSAVAISESDRLRIENKALQETAVSAQSDKGATLYALVIVVIGLLLAFAVFFGLRHSGS